MATSFDEAFGSFSSDGRWVVYVSDSSGQKEIYITPSDGSGGRLQISTSGGDYPRWGPDGSRVYYLEESVIDQPVMMAVDLTFEDGRARALRPRDLRHLQLVPNWFEELER